MSMVGEEGRKMSGVRNSVVVCKLSISQHWRPESRIGLRHEGFEIMQGKHDLLCVTKRLSSL